MGFPSPSVEALLRRRHPTLRWTVYETSTPWTFVHPAADPAAAEVLAAVARTRRVEPPGTIVACFCGWGFGPIAFGVAAQGQAPRVPAGAVELGARVLDVRGGELRLGPAPVDGGDEGVVLPCAHPRVRVVVSHVPFDAKEPETGWLHVVAYPLAAGLDEGERSGDVVLCEV